MAELGLRYVVGIMSSVSVWKPGEAPLSKAEWKGMGRPTKLLRRDSGHKPMAVKELAHSLPASSWKTVTWWQGTKQSLRFALRCAANPACPSRLLAKQAASRGVALDRVAAWGCGTDQIL